MCLTIVDNNFEKQLDADSKPCSFKPIFAHLIKSNRESSCHSFTLSTARVPEGEILLNYTLWRLPWLNTPSSPHRVQSFGVCACHLVLYDVGEEKKKTKRKCQFAHEVTAESLDWAVVLSSEGVEWGGTVLNSNNELNISYTLKHPCQYFPHELNASKAARPVYRLFW